MQSEVQCAKEVSTEELQESIPEGERREYKLEQGIHTVHFPSKHHVHLPALKL